MMNFKGKIFYKNEAGYEEARVGRLFNHRRPMRYPAAVFFPEDADDVIAAVKIAKEKKYRIAIRAGGHSWAAWSVRDEGILLDLKNLNKIEFDEHTKITKAQPAVKGGTELRPFLQKHGLLFPGGHCPTVGIGGFLLQGGQGWNARGWGWAAEFIEGIDVVTADGELVHANAKQHADLYWAARGAGPGFFGVVVYFYLRSVPFPKALVASTYLYPVKHAQTVLQWMQEIHASVSANVEIVVIGQTAAIPDSQSPVPVIIVHVLAFENRLEDGIKSLAPFETCPVIEDAYVCRTNYITSFEEEIKLQLEANPEGHRWVVNNAWLQGSPEKVAAHITPAFTTLPGAKAFSLWYSMAPLRPLPDMAFSLQSDIYFASYVIWENEEDDEKNIAWLATIMKEIEPVTAGQYLGDSDFTAHQRKFMADKIFKKLQEIKKQRDPDNIFHSYLKNTGTVLNKNDFE